MATDTMYIGVQRKDAVKQVKECATFLFAEIISIKKQDRVQHAAIIQRSFTILKLYIQEVMQAVITGFSVPIRPLTAWSVDSYSRTMSLVLLVQNIFGGVLLQTMDTILHGSARNAAIITRWIMNIPLVTLITIAPIMIVRYVK